VLNEKENVSCLIALTLLVGWSDSHVSYAKGCPVEQEEDTGSPRFTQSTGSGLSWLHRSSINGLWDKWRWSVDERRSQSS